MAAGTLHAYAAAQPGARAFVGRETAWGTTLPDGTPVVVRHSRHGGLLAPVTGDLFVMPTRAPRELNAALRLAHAGVATPEIVAYAVYPAFGPFARADVASRFIEGTPLPAAWTSASGDMARDAVIEAVASLLVALRRAGAHHPDLNVSNVLISQLGGQPTAVVLDVDRVLFFEPGSAGATSRNVERLVRSMTKWSAEPGYEQLAAHVRRLRDVALAP